MKRIRRFALQHQGAFDINIRYYRFGHELAGELQWIEFNTGDGYTCKADQLPNMDCQDGAGTRVFLKSAIKPNDW